MDLSDKYIGKLLDNRYEILEKIGTGGMAVVYKARCHRLNRLVAIKILKEELAGDEDFRRRFHTESQAVAMLSHPNIVAVYDVSRTIRADYIVMELIEGITLKQYINRKGLLSWKEALHFSIQIAKAISHAHSKGIIHRDIKPHNIMILKDGSIKVADFGIARLISTQSTLTQESLGSVHYISPEQAKGGLVDARTDIYSLGVVMYEMLTSQLPFVGDSPVSVAIQHISAIPLMPRDINPDVPQGLEDITMHAMEPKLQARYSTADELLRDLEEFRKNPSAVFKYAPIMAETRAIDETRPVPGGAALAKPPEASKTQQSYRRTTPDAQTATRAKTRRGEFVRGRTFRTAMLIAVAATAALSVLALLFIWGNVKDWFAPDDQYITVPDFVGMRYDEVRYDNEYRQFYEFLLAEDSTYSDVYDDGVIYDQRPKRDYREMLSDEKIPVTLYVSLGKRPMPRMPNLIGEDYRTAKNTVERIKADNPDLRLELEIVLQPVKSESVTRDLVIKTVPSEDELLTRNMTIYIEYSEGPEIPMVRVPNVSGKTYSAAKLELESLNLTVGLPVEYVEGEAARDIVVYNTRAGELVEEHEVIWLQLSSGPDGEAPSPSDTTTTPDEDTPTPSEPTTTTTPTTTPTATPTPTPTPPTEMPPATPPDSDFPGGVSIIG
ncbi:MAG: Stk1 family PASTA domain-containing Ser/Thr kinase [Oscillospiraceae bacterium]|jgi:serine/threonine-protein kinase|nr:Stk1 family PASTA domain-containing Ser/Thr kinase [Oscillospiraceae bacterium]